MLIIYTYSMGLNAHQLQVGTCTVTLIHKEA